MHSFGSPTGSAAISSRLDRLPRSRYLRGLVTRISIGGLFELYDLFMTGYIAVGLIRAGIFTATTRGLFDGKSFASFIASGFAGMFLGTLVFSRLSDRLGRRTMFTVSLLWYSSATLVMAFMSSAWAIDLWRFICGLGIGVQLVTISSYITEITPRSARGRYIAYSQFISYLGVPLVAAISLLAIPHRLWGLEGWRFVAIAGSLGAVFAGFLRLRLPESPRWLEAHHRPTEAEGVMALMERQIMQETGAELPLPGPAVEDAAPRHTSPTSPISWSEIWKAGYRRRTLMLTVFNAFQAIGYYGFAAWVPVLLLSEGIEVTRSLTYVLVIACLNPFGSLIAMRFADVVQRKWQIVSLALIVAVCGLLWAQQRHALGILLFGSIITLANSWFSSALHTYQAELFPTRIRAQAVGFVYSWSRFTSIFAGFLIAAVLQRAGTTGVFAVVATAMAVVAIVVSIFGPDSNHLGLEELSG
ncbi:MAG TPA: MFS transporter [Candidatus Saccharimonadales bacterium]|jgi:putative MFS transporter|nr:MFS transporter [Candidatus Saccharimonadales bacterium]